MTPTDEIQLLDALRPFATAFSREMAKARSKSRKEWNGRMPDKFPIKLEVTMGDCRKALRLISEKGWQ